MNKSFDVFIGRLGARNTRRVAKSQTAAQVEEWKAKGYQLQAERRVTEQLHEIYLVSL
ncbi:hypothetical protein [Comamonas sp. JUb58]|uniref:hypothetical protein n=1 Tax=Comamonas sp. JUb58 TaxID=2485114 RepID=UPI0014151F9B|nr:hypothetical protein [Comamonas sp. JUb58]